jgi:hypothetical protein
MACLIEIKDFSDQTLAWICKKYFYDDFGETNRKFKAGLDLKLSDKDTNELIMLKNAFQLICTALQKAW